MVSSSAVIISLNDVLKQLGPITKSVLIVLFADICRGEHLIKGVDDFKERREMRKQEKQKQKENDNNEPSSQQQEQDQKNDHVEMKVHESKQQKREQSPSTMTHADVSNAINDSQNAENQYGDNIFNSQSVTRLHNGFSVLYLALITLLSKNSDFYQLHFELPCF